MVTRSIVNLISHASLGNFFNAHVDNVDDEGGVDRPGATADGDDNDDDDDDDDNDDDDGGGGDGVENEKDWYLKILICLFVM